MSYGLKIFNSGGIETVNLTSNTGLIIAQYNYGPLIGTNDFLYSVTDSRFVNCYAIAVPTASRMFTSVFTSFSGTTLNTYIHTTADNSGNPTDTYVSVCVIDKGSL